MTPAAAPTSAVPRDDALLVYIQSHIETEEGLLRAYEELGAAGPGHVRYLVALIAEDQRRHHRLLQEMAARIVADWGTGGGPAGPAVPGEDYEPGDADRLEAETNRFLDLERSDLHELRRLERTLRHQPENPLFPLLVRIMELDTAKHVAILEFLRWGARFASR